MSRSKEAIGLLVVAVLCLTANPANALLTGVPVWNTLPTSSMGTITLNTLVVTPFANGFSVSGQIGVNITSASATGLLLAYEIDYPIDPAYPFNPTLFTTTVVDGYSLPPVGVVGNTAGYVDSIIVTLPNTPLVASASAVPLSLVAGFDSPPWTPPIGGNSGTFAFGGAPNMALRQRFTLDGDYQSGPGGVWTIDLPVLTFITVVPEPSSATLGLAALASLVSFRRRSITRRASPN